MQGSDFVDSDKVALREDSGIVAPILWFLWNLAFPKPGDVQTDIPNISPQQKKTPSRDPRNKCPNPEGAFCCVAEGKFREAPFPDPDLNNKNYQFIPGLSPRARVYKDYDDCVFCKSFLSFFLSFFLSIFSCCSICFCAIAFGHSRPLKLVTIYTNT